MVSRQPRPALLYPPQTWQTSSQPTLTITDLPSQEYLSTMDTIKQALGTPSAHTEEQQRHIYDNLPAEQREKQSYADWVKEVYNDQYEKWMPWLEDQYLKWFGNGDNKASYATKDSLSKTKITGSKQVDQIQDDVNNLIGNQVGENGLLAPLGNMASKEGINRAERGGKDDQGSYGGPMAGITDPVDETSQRAGQGLSSGIQSAGSSLASGAQNVGSVLPGFGSK